MLQIQGKLHKSIDQYTQQYQSKRNTKNETKAHHNQILQKGDKDKILKAVRKIKQNILPMVK